jgi:hypothetical protein
MTDRKSLPTYIAWLSTCLLTAAAGQLIDDFTVTAWFIEGTFGLICAVGLQITAQSVVGRPA